MSAKYTHTHTRTHTHRQTNRHRQTDTYTQMHTHTQRQTHRHTYTHTPTHIDTHTPYLTLSTTALNYFPSLSQSNLTDLHGQPLTNQSTCLCVLIQGEHKQLGAGEAGQLLHQ